MSKTFTSKPAVVRDRNPNTSNRNQTGTVPKANSNRGRERGTTMSGPMANGIGRGLPSTRGMVGGSIPTRGTASGAMAARGTGRGAELENTDDGQTRQQLDQSQRMSYQGGYTMITPNEKRRQQIQNQAARETQNYQQHKEQKKVGHMSYVGTVGGGEITELQARSRLIQENRNPKMRLREKGEEYRSQQKKIEDEKIKQKKDKQREHTEKNKLMQQKRETDQRSKWDEDKKNKNDRFLSTLGQKSSQNRQQDIPQNPRSPVSHTGSSNEPSTSLRSSSNNAQPIDSQSANRDMPITDNLTSIESQGAFGNMHLKDSAEEDIKRLHEIFPLYDRQFLQDILEQTDSIDDAIEMLMLQVQNVF